MESILDSRSTIIPVPDATEDNFDRDEVGWIALAPTIAITAIASIIVILRWYTRALVARCIGKDDYIILLSMILSWAMCIMTGLEYSVGFGSYGHRDIDVATLAKLIVANNDIWSLATNVTKASIIAQYLRVFPSPILRYTCNLLLPALLLSACWAIFGGTFLCNPIQKLWTPGIPGRCLDPLVYWMSAAILNATLDLAVLILPLPWIFTLHLPYRQKVCIISLFMLGFVGFLVSIVRFATVFVEAHKGDRTKSGMYAVLWSAIEVNVGIICASCLALRPLIARWFPSALQSTCSRDLEHCIVGSGEIRRADRRTTEVIEISRESRSLPSSSGSQSTDHSELKEAGIIIKDFGH